MKNILLLFCFMVLFIYSTDAQQKYINEDRWIMSDGGLKLRVEPNQSSTILKIIPNGEKLILLFEDKNDLIIDGITGKWSKVKWQNNEGWVFSAYLVKKVKLENNSKLISKYGKYKLFKSGDFKVAEDQTTLISKETICIKIDNEVYELPNDSKKYGGGIVIDKIEANFYDVDNGDLVVLFLVLTASDYGPKGPIYPFTLPYIWQFRNNEFVGENVGLYIGEGVEQRKNINDFEKKFLDDNKDGKIDTLYIELLFDENPQYSKLYKKQNQYFIRDKRFIGFFRSPVIINNDTNVLNGPSTESESLGKINKGTKIYISYCTEKAVTLDNITDRWFKINFEGKEGWIFGKYLDN